MSVLNMDDGTVPLLRDSFIICRSGGPSAWVSSLNRLVGMGSNRQVVDLGSPFFKNRLQVVLYHACAQMP